MCGTAKRRLRGRCTSNVTSIPVPAMPPRSERRCGAYTCISSDPALRGIEYARSMWNIHRGSKRTPAAFSFATTCNMGRRTGTNLETLFNAIVLDRQRSSRQRQHDDASFEYQLEPRALADGVELSRAPRRVAFVARGQRCLSLAIMTELDC